MLAIDISPRVCNEDAGKNFISKCEKLYLDGHVWRAVHVFLPKEPNSSANELVLLISSTSDGIVELFEESCTMIMKLN